MKKILLSTLLIFGLTALSSISYAKSNLWEKAYINALQKGMSATVNKGGESGAASSQEAILKNAIKNALAMKAPVGQMIKIAVNMQYNPYSVIKNILSLGGKISLNQLFMYASQSGINKQIVAKAAEDAVTPTGAPVYSKGEITQAQALKNIGLGYTPSAVTMPPAIKAPGKVAEVFSQSAP